MKIFIQNLEDGIYEFEETVAPQDLELPQAGIQCRAIRVHALVDRLDNIFRIKLAIETVQQWVCDCCLDAG